MLRLSFCRMAAERFHMFLQEWTVVPLPPLHSEHFCKDVMIKSWTKLTNPQIYEERQMVHVSPKVSHALSLLYLFLYLYLYYILLYLHLYPHCIVSIFSHELPLVCPFFICVYIFNCICVFIWICICICIYICICICVCICVCFYICICICSRQLNVWPIALARADLHIFTGGSCGDAFVTARKPAESLC